MKPMMHPVNRKDFSNVNDVLPRSGRSMRRLDESKACPFFWLLNLENFLYFRFSLPWSEVVEDR